MIRMLSLVVALFAMMLFIQNAVAASCVQNNNKISLVGLDSSNGTVYASVSGHNNGCGCSYFRFTGANTDSKMVLSVLLSSKVSGMDVRIDALDSTNCNSGYRAYIQ